MPPNLIPIGKSGRAREEAGQDEEPFALVYSILDRLGGHQHDLQRGREDDARSPHGGRALRV
eukprot:7380647-Prymnesium_polylepis.4